MMRGESKDIAGNQAIMRLANSASSAQDLQAVTVHLVISNHLVSQLPSVVLTEVTLRSYHNEGYSYLTIYLNLSHHHLLYNVSGCRLHRL
jgi:hypothetical protein